MAYIGNQPNIGNWRKLDDISGSFNGSTTGFTTAVGGENVTAASPNQLIISLGGVIQEPGVDFTVTTNTITFTTAPASGLSFFGVYAGDSLNIAGPSDGTVGTSALQDGAVTSSKILDGAVTSAKILDGTIVDADVNASAAIAGSKIQAASTSNVGAVQLTDSTSSTSTTTAATPNSVKSSYDLANAALPKTGGIVTGDVTLDNQSDLRFREATANGTNYVGFQAPASISSDLIWTLPATDGTSSQVLQTNGSGVLSFATISAGPTLGTAIDLSSPTGNTGVTLTGIPTTANRVIVSGYKLHQTSGGSLATTTVYPRGYFVDNGGRTQSLYVKHLTLTTASKTQSGAYGFDVAETEGTSSGVSSANAVVSFQTIFTRVTGNYWTITSQGSGTGSTGNGLYSVVTQADWLMSGAFTSVHVRISSGTYDSGIINVMYD